jgi:hypothetical protein
MAEILAPTRKQLIDAWHKRCPTLTRAEAAMSLDEWLDAGCLDIKRDQQTGEWKVLLSEPQTRQ